MYGLRVTPKKVEKNNYSNEEPKKEKGSFYSSLTLSLCRFVCKAKKRLLSTEQVKNPRFKLLFLKHHETFSNCHYYPIIHAHN